MEEEAHLLLRNERTGSYEVRTVNKVKVDRKGRDLNQERATERQQLPSAREEKVKERSQFCSGETGRSNRPRMRV